MKANKKTLMAIKAYFKNDCCFDVDEFIDDLVGETKLFKCKEMGNSTLATDECNINWGEDYVCNLSEFLNSYTELFFNKICNVLDSFVGDDLDCYLEEE